MSNGHRRCTRQFRGIQEDAKIKRPRLAQPQETLFEVVVSSPYFGDWLGVVAGLVAPAGLAEAGRAGAAMPDCAL